MNTNSRTKKRVAGCLLLAVAFAIIPFNSAKAQSDDELGVWTTVEASTKLSKGLKLEFEAEHRTIDSKGTIDRVSLGAGVSYKITKWLKASAGYIFIYGHTPEEKKIKWEDALINDFGTFYDYNIDHAYWTDRHRAHISFSGEYKIGRVELSLRERFQYTYTSSATTDETKYRWQQNFDANYNEMEPTLILRETAPELKDAKHNVTLRSRLTAKWDIANCKITPFASVELYTRLDDWKGFDKLRYRLGASYKIDKDNEITLYYLFQHENDIDKPRTHAIGLGYSIDL